MSLKKQAQNIQKVGFANSGQDTMLAHINPKEAFLLKLFGGSGRQDPQTGLPHFDEAGGGGDGWGGGPGGSGGGWGGDGGGAFGGSSSWGGGDGGDSSGLAGWGMANSENFPGSDSWGNTGSQFSLSNPFATDITSFGDQSFGLSPDTSSFGEMGSYSSPFGDSTTSPVAEFLSKLAKQAIMSKLGPAASMVNTMNNQYQSKNPGQTALNTFGSTVGGLLGSSFGPVGAFAGSQLGGRFGNGFSGGDASAAGNSRGGGMSDLAGGLASLFGYSKANSGLKDSIGGLQGLYSPNGAYAQQLRQQLERRDAAAGRRSQYGPREVQLMAALADRSAQSIPQLQKLRDQQNQLRAQGLAQLFNAGKSSGIFDKIGSGLSDMWNSGVSSGVSSGMLPSVNVGDMSENPFMAMDL